MALRRAIAGLTEEDNLKQMNAIYESHPNILDEFHSALRNGRGGMESSVDMQGFSRVLAPITYFSKVSPLGSCSWVPRGDQRDFLGVL